MPTDQKSYEDRCAEIVTLPMEEDFTKRLKVVPFAFVRELLRHFTDVMYM